MCTFFTILRAAWLVHPSQIVQRPIPTKTTTSPYLPFVPTLTMGRGKTALIKGTSTKDNKDSKHRKNQNTGSSSTRPNASKVPAGQKDQQLTNTEASPPSPKPTGQMNQQPTNDLASSPPPKSTANDALVITPDNRKSPIDVDDGDDPMPFQVYR